LQDRGIKQAFLANTTGISASAISDICTGARKNLDVVEYKKICNALDVPYETFLED